METVPNTREIRKERKTKRERERKKKTGEGGSSDTQNVFQTPESKMLGKWRSRGGIEVES